MKKIVTLVIIGICIIMGGCGNKEPSDQQIIEDIPIDVTRISINNPITYTYDEQELEVTKMELDRSQTMNSSYTGYYIINLENDFYSCIKYLVLDYEKYDGGKWVLENYHEYQETEYSVKSNPFLEEDFIEKYTRYDDGNYFNVQIESELNNNLLTVNCTYEKNYTYSDTTITIYEEYCFSDGNWVANIQDRRVDNNWIIDGKWQLCSPSNYAEFELNIENFDSDSFTANGKCRFGYKGSWIKMEEHSTYLLKNATIVENNDACLIIMFDGDVNSSILGLGRDVFVAIMYDEANAYYGSNYREKIKLSNK